MRRFASHRFVVVVAVIAGALAGVGCVNLARPEVSDLGDGGQPDRPPDVKPDRPMDTPGGDVPVDKPSPPDVVSEVMPDGGADTMVDVGYDNGHGCITNAECGSRLCIDGVCCASTCTDLCSACNVAGSEGTCTPIPAGEDPAEECAMEAMSTCGNDGTCNGLGGCRKYPMGTQCQAPSCTGSMETPASSCDATGVCKAEPARACPGGGMCKGNSCGTACTNDSSCQTGFFCRTGVCMARLAPGAACTRREECGSQYCVDRVCCGTPCTETCSACNVAGSPGTCKPVAAGQDPRNDCAEDTGNTCGFDGTCNGAGACRQPSGKACGAASCTNGAESLVGSCNGVGTCTPGPARDCGAYACAGTACGTSCTSEANCAPGHACLSNVCVQLPGPVLYWKLDEATGTTAFDATTNGYNGTYVSTLQGQFPATSSLLPPLTFANAASRAFVRYRRDSIVMNDVPNPLKPTVEITVSAWYRSLGGDPDTGDAEVVSLGDNVIMRIRPTSVEFAKRTTSGHKQCWLYPAVNNIADGNWHHLAGVATANDFRVYLDGTSSTPCAQTAPIYYLNARADLWIGRHGLGTSDLRDFEGNVDEVRIYTRALSAAEIARLAAGKP